MRFLVDECVAGVIVDALKGDGHDVVWVKTLMRSASDEQIFARAAEEQRVVVTSDKDFGELIYRSRRPLPAGVVLLRLPPMTPSDLATLVLDAIRSRDDWVGASAVITQKGTRSNRLPKR